MRWYLIPLMIVLFTGCSIKPEPGVALKKLRLEAAVNTLKSTEQSSAVLKVSIPYGLRALQSHDILYTKGDGIYSAYRDHRWEETPARQLTLVLSDMLQESRLFANVVSVPSKIGYDYLLESRISALEHHVEEGRSFVRLHVTLYLVDALKKRVVGSMGFKVDEPTASTDATGAVKAFNSALTKFNEKSFVWLKGMYDAKAF